MSNLTRTILVTGSSTGFGRLSALALAAAGHKVYASMRNALDRPEGASLVQEATERGWDLSLISLDVTDDASVEAAVANIIEQSGKIDVVVNNAGTANFGLAEAFTLEQARRQFETNYFGVVRVNRAVLPHLRAQGGGLLIHVSSAGGRVILPFGAHYSASKFALEALAESLHYELSSFGIESVIVEPGAYPTEIFGKNSGPEDTERLSGYGPLADAPGQMFAAIAEQFSGDQAPNPQDVSDAIVKLIDTPAGQRPLRTLVGFDAALVQPLNDLGDKVQRDLYNLFGIGELIP